MLWVPGLVLAGDAKDEAAFFKSFEQTLLLHEGDMRITHVSHLKNMKTCPATGSPYEELICLSGEADLADFRKKTALTCFPSAASAERVEEKFWRMDACFIDAYLEVWLKRVDPASALYKVPEPFEGWHPSCLRELIEFAKENEHWDLDLCSKLKRNAMFQDGGDTRTVLIPGWGEARQPYWTVYSEGELPSGARVLSTRQGTGGSNIRTGFAIIYPTDKGTWGLCPVVEKGFCHHQPYLLLVF